MGAAIPRAGTEARRHRRHGQLGLAQEGRDCSGDRSRLRAAALSASLQSRPQSDRTAFRQTQGLLEANRRPHHGRTLVRDRHSTRPIS